jgi:asparagine synthase (glutamine-hydrolysing)
MSAIAGAWMLGGETSAADACQRMLLAQALYGPDAEASWADRNVALGRRLFRTLPEDAFDAQPIAGPDGAVLVADIRLDNRDELIGELDLPLQEARVSSDAAVLGAAWRRWGLDCFDHLVGDYAFAVWEAAHERLILARDPLGQRPLHYHQGARWFVFASMPKGIHALPQAPRGPDEERLAQFLAQMPETGSRSFFRGIERVEPGCFVVVTRDGTRSHRHWKPSLEPIQLPSTNDYAAGLREKLQIAVSARLRGSGSKTGVQLSSGWDSAAVASTAARLCAPRGRGLVAFTAAPRDGYDGPSPAFRLGDEAPLAAATAARYPNIDHGVARSTGRSPADDFDRFFFLSERPPLNPCNNVWVTDIYRAAQARGIRVLLTGGCGNLTLTQTGLDRLSELLGAAALRQWLREASALVRAGELRWSGAWKLSLEPWLPRRRYSIYRRLRIGIGESLRETTSV